MLFCICHYRNTKEVNAFIAHVKALDPNNCVSICDNSDDLVLEAADERLLLGKPGQNLGYLNGCAWAREEWVRRYGIHAELTVVCNTDLLFGPETSQEAARALLLSNLAGIAPNVRHAFTGHPHNPHLRVRPTRSRIRFLRSVHHFAPVGALYMLLSACRRRLQIQREDIPQPAQRIYAPHGAVMAFHPEFFRRGGQLAFGGFIHDEELHVAEQARLLDLEWHFWPTWSVLHEHHASLHAISLLRQSRWHGHSLRWIWGEYFCRSCTHHV